MKLDRLGFALIFAVAAPAAAWAGGGDKDSMWKMMDANGDGKISSDEHSAAAKKMFDMMDGNKDGKVTVAEMEAAQSRMPGRKVGAGEMSAAQKIKTVDTNGDGILSADEHAAGAKTMFEKMDTDHDGSLSPAELEAGHSKLMKR